MSVVRGGSSESITALLSKKLPTPELMRLWGEGVQFNPDFIRRTVSCFFTSVFSNRDLLLLKCAQAYLPKSQFNGQKQAKCSSVINDRLGNRTASVPVRLSVPVRQNFIAQPHEASVSHQTRPLYELVISRDFSQASTLKRNLKRALSEYLAEASSCRCAPCLNNGVAVLRGNTEFKGVFYASKSVGVKGRFHSIV